MCTPLDPIHLLPMVLSNTFEVFEESVNNKIFFAGEHTIYEYRYRSWGISKWIKRS